MRTNPVISLIFIVASLYEGLLGIVFLLANDALFKWFCVTPPNHAGYVQFPAALLIVFAIMFMAVAMNPVKNRNLIPYGILLKLSYCGIVMFHWITTGLPDMWKPFCIFDLAFLIVFAWAWALLRKEKTQNDWGANQKQQPTVKTPVESCNEQNTAAEL